MANCAGRGKQTCFPRKDGAGMSRSFVRAKRSSFQRLRQRRSWSKIHSASGIYGEPLIKGIYYFLRTILLPNDGELILGNDIKMGPDASISGCSDPGSVLTYSSEPDDWYEITNWSKGEFE